MRVTNEIMVSSTLRRLSTRLERYEKTQAQLGSGKQILAPSDDPSATSRQLALRASQRAREQELRNAEDARSALAAADHQLQAGVERLQRARELALRGAGSASPDERTALAAEITTIRDELLAIANSRHGSRPLFSGFSDRAPVAQQPDGTWAYQGDGGQTLRRIGEQDVVAVNVPGDDVFGFAAEVSSAGASPNLFRMLDTLAADVAAGNNAGVRSALGSVDTARQRLGDAQGRIGTTANWVESAITRNQGAMQAIRGELSVLEDVDLAEAMMELKTQEVAYQATLQALGRALPPSLVSFLS